MLSTSAPQRTMALLRILPLLSVVVSGLYAWAVGASNDEIFGLFALTVIGGLALLFVGGFFGFIFAVPKVNASFDADTEKTKVARYVNNSNLADISDWLTKVIVGVTLTQLLGLPAALGELEQSLSVPLGGATYSGLFGLALIGYNLILGFFIAYIWTGVNWKRALEAS